MYSAINKLETIILSCMLDSITRKKPYFYAKNIEDMDINVNLNIYP